MTAQPTPEEAKAMIDELERLEREATAGPWLWDKRASDGGAPVIAAPSCWMGTSRVVAKVMFHSGSEDPEVHQNARLIVKMRETLPMLLALSRRAIDADLELEELRAKFRQCSPMDAKECPRCGTCSCGPSTYDPLDFPDTAGCPLHDTRSTHASPPFEDALPPVRGGAGGEGT